MDAQLDAAGQILFNDACVAIEAGADDVTVMEKALDVICVLLRREDDRLLRDKAMDILSHSVAEMERQGELPGDHRARQLRNAARQAICVVITERPSTGRTRPAAPPPYPARRASDPSAG